ncbi:hypothetical protein [Psychrobacillus sp. OK032]|uniref:hypothetical protein n=1 Tax=Psychrobacillus sp. OK032 TaxID=1884358 RepID=UPI0008C9F584|nr:hypothetical protein [Psychrobacillus sp. OK032]SER83027.1 hypothetical protein SAMN05518872_102232 [Psychrobacillus sp. OK032]
MSVQRKQIILNEIAFWKKNKLLPEHYCDFLTALYAQGEGVEDERKEKYSQALLAKENKNKTFLYVILGFVTVLLIASLILDATAAFIPIIATGIAICLFLYIAIKLAKTKSIMTPLLFVFSALLLLGISFKVWDVYFIEYPLVLIGFMIGNCLIWLFSGLLLKLVYFSISGMVGTALILFYLFKFYF